MGLSSQLPDHPSLNILANKFDNRNISLTKTGYDAAFINIYGVFRFDLSVLFFPDIEVPMHCFRSERVEPVGLLTSPNLCFDLRMSLDKSGNPIASQLVLIILPDGLGGLLIEKSHNAGTDLAVRRSITHRLLTKDPRG